jgi:hypothetical protein
MGPRVGSHSGFSVETTNKAARQSVVACEKMIQRRRMAMAKQQWLRGATIYHVLPFVLTT